MLNDSDDEKRRPTLYEDLFNGISENKRIEVGLRSVITMNEQYDPKIRELAQAVLEEIEFFRNRRKGIGYRAGIVHKTPQSEIQIEKAENKVCDPIVLEMCQVVMSEITYIRKTREVQRRCFFYIGAPFFVIFTFIVLGGIIFGITQIFSHA